MNKVYPDPKSALDGLLFDGMTIMSGGFGLCGIPEKLIAALHAIGNAANLRHLRRRYEREARRVRICHN